MSAREDVLGASRFGERQVSVQPVGRMTNVPHLCPVAEEGAVCLGVVAEQPADVAARAALVTRLLAAG